MKHQAFAGMTGVLDGWRRSGHAGADELAGAVVVDIEAAGDGEAGGAARAVEGGAAGTTADAASAEA